MRQSSIRVEYQKTGKLDDVSRHGLLAAAYQFAQTKGIFEHWEDLPLKMKSVTYSPADKLKTLWASIIVGCQHTFDINCELGAHEKALAELFGLKRFPDQSQVNRLLRRATQQTVECYREQHFELLCRHSRSRRRKLWAQLKKGRRYLVADLDQRALVVSGKQFELAEKGYFGRHRGHAGYQLSALFLGGEIGEVVDEYFDPGNTQAKVRVADLLASLSEFCRRRKIDPRRVILRGDAQFGTPSNIALVESCGFKYLFKGLSPQKAANLAKEATPLGGIYLRVKPGAEDQARWMADLGEHQHCDRSEAGAGKRIECRTLVMVCTRQVAAPNPKHHGKKRSEEEARTRLRHDYFLTNLSAEELSVEKVLEFYDDRATIERYFCDEQYALGAKSVRTWCFYGEALFQYMVATTNNLLRWFKHELLRETEFESYGLKRIIKELMQIPARLIHKGANWIVEVSHLHAQAGKLLDQWHITEIPESP
jgi:hypothetical protein